MSTGKQVAANTQNAKKSTGPRTPKGRARSSMNALKHGLSTRDFVVFERERLEFETFMAAWSLDLSPVGALEEEFFAQITQAAWNMRRVRRAESNFTGEKNRWFKDAEDDPLTKSHKISYLDHYARYHARNERTFYRALRELRSLQTDRAFHDAIQCRNAPTAPEPESVTPDLPPSPSAPGETGVDVISPPAAAAVRPPAALPVDLYREILHRRSAPLASFAKLTKRTHLDLLAGPPAAENGLKAA